jgi:cytochrome c peroxidase
MTISSPIPAAHLRAPARRARWAPVLLLAAAAGCERRQLGDDIDGFTAREWTLIEQIKPLATPMLANPANRWADDPAAAKLGQMLWYDPDFSSAIRVEGPSGRVGEKGKVACVTCHDPTKSFVDTRTRDPVSHGTAYTRRNSPALVNLGWYEWFTWAGRMDSLAMQGANAPEAPTDVATTRLFFAHVLFRKYRAEYDAVFSETPLDPALDPMHPDAARFPAEGRPKASPEAPDGPWEAMKPEDRRAINLIMANVGKAYEAFERRLVSRGSRFERYVDAEYGALDGVEKRGLRLFIGKAACNDCHIGPVLSDNKFHNLGVPQAVDARLPVVEGGRLTESAIVVANPFRSEGDFSDDKAYGKAKLDRARADMTDERMRGAFRTSMLLNIADSPPYFHNGSMRSLEEVVHFYNRGGGEPGTYAGVKDPRIRPLQLTPQEESELVAFLRTLTGNPVDAQWQADTAKKM